MISKSVVSKTSSEVRDAHNKLELARLSQFSMICHKLGEGDETDVDELTASDSTQT